MKIFIAILGFLLSVGTASAQLCNTLPNAFTNGSTADADQVMGNFDYLKGCFVSPIFSGNVSVNGTFTPSQTNGIVGTTTNNNANAGSVGEYVGAYANFTNYPGSAVWGDLTSISLTAGDWDVTGIVTVTSNGATISSVNVIGVSSTSGNSGSGLFPGSNRADGLAPTSLSDVTLTIPNYRVSIASTTTYYLKYIASYSVATPQAAGRLSARRVR